MPDQVQTPWGGWDEQSAKDELAKMEGDFLSVPSPTPNNGMWVRFAPRHPNMRLPFMKYLLHFAVYVDGYDAIHVCLKHFDEKAFCPLCASTRKLYEASQAEKDIFYNAGGNIRQKANYYWNTIPNIYEAKCRDGSGNEIFATAILPNAPTIRCLPYGAGESVQRRLLQFRPDNGDFTDPITGRNIKLNRQAVGDQAAKFAPTQVDISGRVTPVTQDIYDHLKNPGVRDLSTLYQPTAVELLTELCRQYVSGVFEKAGVRQGSSVQSPGIPTPPAAPAAQPLTPPGVAPAPAPAGMTAAAAPAAPPPRPTMPDMTPPTPAAPAPPAAPAAAPAPPAASAAPAMAMAPAPAGAIPVQNIDRMVAGIGGQG